MISLTVRSWAFACIIRCQLTCTRVIRVPIQAMNCKAVMSPFEVRVCLVSSIKVIEGNADMTKESSLGEGERRMIT